MLEVMPAAAKRAVCKFKGEPKFGSYRIGKTNSSTHSAVSREPLPKFVGQLSTAGFALTATNLADTLGNPVGNRLRVS